jgi:hypothetical protein
MGFWKKLFRKGETPDPVVVDETLGNLKWNQDIESWEGCFNGLKFGVAYDYERTPKKGCLEYAKKIVTDEEWIKNTLQSVKQKAIAEYPKDYHKEIELLVFKYLNFFDHERLFIQFYESDDEPWWFAEVMNGVLEDVGFDT